MLINPLKCPSCPFLVQHLTSCIPAIGGVLFLFVLLTLLRTSFSDPGILPRATPDEAAEVEKQIGELRRGGAQRRASVCSKSCFPSLWSWRVFRKLPSFCRKALRPDGLLLRRRLWKRWLPPSTANPGGGHQPAGGEGQVLLHLQDVPASADLPLQPV